MGCGSILLVYERGGALHTCRAETRNVSSSPLLVLPTYFLAAGFFAALLAAGFFAAFLAAGFLTAFFAAGFFAPVPTAFLAAAFFAAVFTAFLAAVFWAVFLAAVFTAFLAAGLLLAAVFTAFLAVFFAVAFLAAPLLGEGWGDRFGEVVVGIEVAAEEDMCSLESRRCRMREALPSNLEQRNGIEWYIEGYWKEQHEERLRLARPYAKEQTGHTVCKTVDRLLKSHAEHH